VFRNKIMIAQSNRKKAGIRPIMFRIRDVQAMRMRRKTRPHYPLFHYG
jgi:hypothetical protein